MQFSNGRVMFIGRQGRFQQAMRRKGEENRQGPKDFRQEKTISKGLIDWGRMGAELLHLSCLERLGRRQPAPSPWNSLPLLYLYCLSPLFPSSGNNSDSPKSCSYLPSYIARAKRALDNSSCSCCCHHWQEPCECHSCPLQAQKLPLAATTAFFFR